MARYEHLRVFRTYSMLAAYLEQAVARFPRYHKYAIGTDLRRTGVEVLKLIVAANDSRGAERLSRLDELCRKGEELKLLLQLAKEVRAFQSFKAFQHAAGLALDGVRQAEAWRRGQRRGGAQRAPKRDAGNATESSEGSSGQNHGPVMDRP